MRSFRRPKERVMSERKYSDYAARCNVDKVEQENADLKIENAGLVAEVDRLSGLLADAERKPRRRSKRKGKDEPGVKEFDERFAKLEPKDKRSVSAMMRVIKAILDGKPAMFCMEAQFVDEDGETMGIEVYDVARAMSPMLYEFVGRIQSMVNKLVNQADDTRENEVEPEEERTMGEMKAKYGEPQEGCDCPRCRMLRRIQEARGRGANQKDMN
jgi:hypothetical protein